MKMIAAVIATVLLSSMSFAQEPGAKMTKKEAKAACKSEGKKGKELKACIKSKTM